MVLKYSVNFEAMSPASDFGVVPDDTYGSPANSPYANQNYEVVHSPASSEADSVDSAFEELFEVIPEIDSTPLFTESQKTYCDLTIPSPWSPTSSSYADDSGYECDETTKQSPSMYDAVYTMSPEKYEPDTKTSSLLKAAKMASSKRPSPFWFSDTTDMSELADVGGSTKKPRLSEGNLMVKQTNSISTLKSKKIVSYEDGLGNGDNYIVFSRESTVYSKDIEPIQRNNSKGSLLMLDEDILTKGFEVLAQYLCADTQLSNVPSDSPKQNAVKTEEVAQNKMSSAKVLTCVANRVTVLDSVSSEMKSYAASQKSGGQEQSSLLFSMSNTKVEETKAKKVALNLVSQNKTTAADLVGKWKAPARQKRPMLNLQSSKPRLYNFLLELLQDPQAYPCIEWVDECQGIFKFLDSAKIASLWGHRKNKPFMKYENFARSLRTYIAKGILTKPRNKLVYQFTSKVM